MTTIKSFTDLEQSKKLAEILPLESADMMYHSVENEYGSSAFVATSKVITNGFKNDDFYTDDIPCWSFTALLSVLPKIGSEEPMIRKLYYASGPTERYIRMYSIDNVSSEYNNPVDACYEMILKLHELKML